MDYQQAINKAEACMSGPAWTTKSAKIVITLPDGTVLTYDDVSLYGVSKTLHLLGGPNSSHCAKCGVDHDA